MTMVVLFIKRGEIPYQGDMPTFRILYLMFYGAVELNAFGALGVQTEEENQERATATNLLRRRRKKPREKIVLG